MKNHTADLDIRISAAGLDTLFSRAAMTVAAAAAKKPGGKKTAGVMISVSAPGLPELLHDFLNEIIFIAYVKRKLIKRVKVKVVAGQRPELKAVVEVSRDKAKPGDYYRELKSVTYHGLAVSKAGKKWKAAVVVDV